MNTIDIDELYERVIGLESDMCNIYDVLKQDFNDDFNERLSDIERRLEALEHHV